MKSNLDSLAINLQQLPPLSLYIHMPWCVKKCPYCDFNSHQIKELDSSLQSKYIAAVITDLETSMPLIWGRSIRTIFIGGGTPSLFSGEALYRLLSEVRKLTNFAPNIEITLESNPSTLESSYLAAYHDCGINRVSFGVQSFNDEHLQVLGRIHDAKQAILAVEAAKQYFTNINIDLMYGLPGQNTCQVINDLNIAISLNPSHISYYNLTIEPNTVFAKYTPANLPNNDLCHEMQLALIETLAKANYQRYEISAFAQQRSSHQIKQNECQHNLNYWQFGDYLGIGAGAHSKLSFANRIIRQVRQKQPQTYMQAVANISNTSNANNMSNQQHIISQSDIIINELPLEFALNALRLTNGIALNLFTQTTSLPLNVILSQFEQAKARGFIEYANDRVIPTALGQDFLNELLLLFMNT